MASREYDIVVFGATGFTGKQVVKQLSRFNFNDRHRSTLGTKRWAVGGRRRAALEELQQAWGSSGVVTADVSDFESLKKMAQSTKLVLNATGPYRFFGEAVVKACIEGGADYADLCGEPECMEKMLLQHGDAAKAAGVIICQACAFDSIPADMGILRCAQLFQEAGGECAHVEVYHSIDAPMGYSGHVTTFQAAVHGMGAAKELSTIRRKIEDKHGKIPKGSTVLGPLPKKGGQWWWEPRMQSFAVPFIGADASVVRASRRTMANILKVKDVEKLMPQFGIYFTIKSKVSLAKLILCGGCFSLLATQAWGRKLLLRFPGFFTMGAFSDAGPTPEQMENNTWSGDFFAKGVVGGATKELKLHAELDDPGYIGTGLLFAVVAQTMLEERSKLSAQGGVFTPAALFRTSSLLKRMASHGVEFKVVTPIA